MSCITKIDVDHQPIELCKLLKIANLVAGGGEAKIVIAEGMVLVNNQVELRKRKKITEDDIVEFNGETIQIKVNAPSVKPAQINKAQKSAKRQQPKVESSKTNRKKIRF